MHACVGACGPPKQRDDGAHVIYSHLIDERNILLLLYILYVMERVGWERLDIVGATRVLERGNSTRGMDSAHMQ